MTSSEHGGPLHATGLAFEKLKNRWHLVLTLEDGRVHVVPLTFYPTLQRATQTQRENWDWIGRGDGVHWPDLDLSVGGIAQGRREHVPGRAPRGGSLDSPCRPVSGMYGPIGLWTTRAGESTSAAERCGCRVDDAR